MNNNGDRVIITSSVFIITFMVLDALLSNEAEKIPRQAVNGLILITMLSSLEFVGLGRIAGPFASVIACTVFLTRGERIFTRLSELSKTVPNSGSGGTSGGTTF